MSKLFISHSSQDDVFVRELQQALGDLEQDVWIDSRELHGGDPLWPEIQQAIEDASAYAVVVSTDSLQSKWVGKELRHALDVQKQRGGDEFPVIPLSLNGTKLGVLEEFFGEEPIYIPMSSATGGVEAALNAILVAFGKRLPADVPAEPQPKAEPLEELVLELTDLRFHEQDGVRRASARARLVYEPATQGQEYVHSIKSWRFVAPIGSIEAQELRWYLEKYAIWPSDYFRDRAYKVEHSLAKWGQFLYESALPVAHTANVMNAWARIDDHSGRRFSVHVDATPEAGMSEAEEDSARESATLLLGLPWELLHDGYGFLFQGPKPTRVRRRLPSTRVLDVPVVSTPIRILLVTARPEDDACGYIDHRASALPLVEAIEALGGLVHIHVLDPPTLMALRDELDRARRAGEPYHVVHFDGHGVYDRRVGLGGLCFENPEDIGKLEKRRHLTVFTSQLGALLRDHRIPLFFLEACETAQAEEASESVASELLKVGVASVVAMSHSVLVETARRFVEAFYDALARGARVGDAMLDGQRALKDDNFRGRIFGAGELRLEDWFVPVLFQEKGDPQLFRTTPTWQTREDLQTALAARLGDLPAEPETGFIGRSHELLALQRLLRQDGKARYAVVRGQGGEGKTALAAEFARWMVRSHQIRRAAFVSVETHSNLAAVLDAIGRQLVPDYSVATFDDLEKAVLPVERALTEQSTLLVVDNMESILVPPYLETPEALSEEARRELDAILGLCKRLNAKGDTRLVFTSREELPVPFDAERNRRELHQLDREDAVKLVERALDREGAGAGVAAEAAREAIEQLVDAVHGHARTLVLLAPALRSRGVEATRTSLMEVMAEMDRKFPGSREKSLFAGVELSLCRLSPANRDKSRALGVFHGGVDLNVLCMMTDWKESDVEALARELIETGLATPNRYNYLTLNPALCPYLRGQMDTVDHMALQSRWDDAMRKHVEFLNQQRSQNSELAATLTALDLPNLIALLERMEGTGNPEVTVGLAASLLDLLRGPGKPRLVERVEQVRDAATAALATGCTAWFRAQRSQIAQQLANGDAKCAYEVARKVHEQQRLGTYRNGYDSAYALWDLGRCATAVGSSEIDTLELALKTISEYREVRESHSESRSYERLQGNIHCALGDELVRWGRYDEAHEQYERALQIDRNLDYRRGQAHDLLKLGVVARCRGHFDEALELCSRAFEDFQIWEERTMEPRALLEMGRVHSEAGEYEAAEDSYRKSLAIEVRLGNVAGQANTLGQLGVLYDGALGRPEEAAAFFHQAVGKYVELADEAGEGRTRNSLGATLRELRRFDEARQEIRRAIECNEKFGHAGEPWKSYGILADIEDAEKPAAEARHKAIEHYLAYRRDGGENHNPGGRICLAVTQALLAGDPGAAAARLHQCAADPDLPAWLGPFIQPLQSIVAGSRDRTLADAPDLHYTMAAEILFLIETLEKHDSRGMN